MKPNRMALGCVFVVLIAAMARSGVAAARLELASVFSEHMVLQRDQVLRVWGTGEPGLKVDVSINGQIASATTNANGKWAVELPPMRAGGPFEFIVTNGSDQAFRFRDVLIGDVWLCSGQSNMQFQLKESIGGKEAAGDAARSPNLRLLMIPKKPSDKPQAGFEATWSSATEATDGEFSAVAMYFALALRERSPAMKDIPIGLIDSSFGGTRVEGWIPESTLSAKFNPDQLHDSIFSIKPTQLYNGMIAPLAGANIRGVLWYQGESNAKQAATYPALLRAMIEQWRGDFRNPSLPFYLVQLANYPEPWEGTSFAWLREAQASVAKDVKNVHMTVTIDTPDGYDLHPRHKRQIGERLALLAREHSYGEQVAASGPVLESATIESSHMRLKFDPAGSPLVAKDGTLSAFLLAGADGAYRSATARIDGDDSVIVESEFVSQPKTVRYAFSANPRASLFNRSGLPAAPFRTDDVPQSPMLEIQRGLPQHRVVTENYSVTIEADGRLSSLLVNGLQMLSTDAAGGFMPFSVWGQRKLFDRTEIGPDCIRFADNHASITYTFAPASIRIEVRNDSANEAMPLRFVLAPTIEQVGEFDAKQPCMFKRDRDRISISGAQKCERVLGVTFQLQADVPGNRTQTLGINVQKEEK